MLKPEQAEKALEKFKVKGWHQRRLDALDQLPPESKALALLLFDIDAANDRDEDEDGDEEEDELEDEEEEEDEEDEDEDGDGDGDAETPWERKARLKQEALGQIGALAAEARVALFEAVFPGLGQDLEAMWQLSPRLPYQNDYARKAYRAPGLPPERRPSLGDRLDSLFTNLQGYEQDAVWLAQWAPHVSQYYGADSAGALLAGAVEAGGEKGEQVLQILLQSARNEHPVGEMGRHVTRALLTASRPEGWEFVEKLLLAAQRQEGLRQSILETIDEAHPEAFRRMLRLIREHDLARFSSVVRALDVWLGLGWDSASTRVVNQTLERLARFLEDPEARGQALRTGDGETVYLALWTLGFEDAFAAVPVAAALLADPQVERRFAAVHFLGTLSLEEADLALLQALEDEDVRIVARALQEFLYADLSFRNTDLFERLERVLARHPEAKPTLKPVIWPWMELSYHPNQPAGLLQRYLGERSRERILPYLSRMDSSDRAQVARTLAKQKEWSPATREALLALVGDSAAWVREQAIEACKQFSITAEEAQRMEGYLSRKAADLRRGVLSLLLGQPDEAALRSADRLTGMGQAPKRLAGLELLRRLVETERAAEACRERALAYRAARPRLDEEELRQLEVILAVERKPPTLDDALGLMDPAALTPAPPVQDRGVTLHSPAAHACLAALNALVAAHAEEKVTIKQYDGEKEELLGNINWGFPSPEAGVSAADDAPRLPLREVWEAWWRERPETQRDPDGLELIRAWLLLQAQDYYFSYMGSWGKALYKKLYGDTSKKETEHSQVVEPVLEWLVKLHAPPATLDFLLDGLETVLARLPEEAFRPQEKNSSQFHQDWRADHCPLLMVQQAARNYQAQRPEEWTLERQVRFFHLRRWLDQPAHPGHELPRERVDLEEILPAWEAGHANDDDVIDALLGAREVHGWRGGFHELGNLTRRKENATLQKYPRLREIVERCKERVLQVELERGDTPTAASHPAKAINHAGGLDVLVRLLAAFGKDTFVRGWSSDGESKATVFSGLVRGTFPAEGDSYEQFVQRVAAAQIPRKRLLELAFYAPQWAGHVERAVGWEGLAGAVWWIHAHTKDQSWTVDEEIRDAWTAEVNEFTPLSAQDLLDGGVDVAWFARVHQTLGAERWGELDAAIKFASGGGGHKRAQLYADAMLGRLTPAELTARITEKRQQDAVRALGLIPLPEGSARDAELLARYRTVQEFIRTSRQFGSQRQESEKRAATIGMENLARTAGYADPIRLSWAMEARGIADLAQGPQVVSVPTTQGDVEVSLSLDERGQPDLSISRKGKALKTLPAAVKKVPEVVALRERVTELKRQGSRMRESLEQAMCRGDRFTPGELRELMGHPVLAPMLSRLVLVGESGLGYPEEGGSELLDHAGELRRIRPDDSLRVAHPHDLFQTGEWHLWQRECFLHERIQPFKQVFRELYVLTAGESADGALSRRYDGHQVNPGQALGVLSKRGWVNHPEEGLRRTFHQEGLSAWVEFAEGTFTPADVEGLTVEGVRFSRRGEWKPLPLAEVPPRLFSEAMRDVDLMVSVAHRGGVDPEASASTVEMRATLVRETSQLLNLANVRVEGTHVFIEGHLAQYNVHLGSAVVHRQPGGHLCIVPVHAQHRGRLFLPFADDDPKTAEVVSKVILLARDTEIQDPTILEQLRA